MNWIEAVLLILGVGALAASFIAPGKNKEDDDGQQVDIELIRGIIEKEMDAAKDRVTEVVDETLEYAVEKTERASERISNEKIMAISEYSETVLSDINKSHQEVMFLYDMLNDKHNNLKETVKHVDRTAREAEEAANAAAIALTAKAKEEAEAHAKEKAEEEAARQEVLEHEADVERAAQEKAAREKEYARRQMARLILPMQQELPTHRIGSLRAIPLKTEQDAPDQGDGLRPLIVKSVEIVNSNDMQPVSENTPDAPVSAEELQALGARPENMTVVDVKPADIRSVEVYSFAEQAPRVERPVKKEKEAQTTVPDAAENNNDKILRLHNMGFSNVDIAKELGLGVGEVKLVINLFKGAV